MRISNQTQHKETNRYGYTNLRVAKLNGKKRVQCIFNAIKSSSNLGKKQVANGERERTIQSNKEQLKKKKSNVSQ